MNKNGRRIKDGDMWNGERRFVIQSNKKRCHVGNCEADAWTFHSTLFTEIINQIFSLRLATSRPPDPQRVFPIEISFLINHRLWHVYLFAHITQYKLHWCRFVWPAFYVTVTRTSTSECGTIHVATKQNDLFIIFQYFNHVFSFHVRRARRQWSKEENVKE